MPVEAMGDTLMLFKTRVTQLPLKKKPGVSHPPEFDGKG
jgi:hypothetical protein